MNRAGHWQRFARSRSALKICFGSIPVHRFRRDRCIDRVRLMGVLRYAKAGSDAAERIHIQLRQ